MIHVADCLKSCSCRLFKLAVCNRSPNQLQLHKPANEEKAFLSLCKWALIKLKVVANQLLASHLLFFKVISMLCTLIMVILHCQTSIVKIIQHNITPSGEAIRDLIISDLNVK